MPRPARAFRAESFELEGRLLLAFAHPSAPPSVSGPSPPVQFESATSTPPETVIYSYPAAGVPAQVITAGEPTEVVTQQAGAATVMLSRANTAGSLQVGVTAVTLDPSSPHVNAVDQTVTFADGQSQATLTVPIPAVAPNPGAVDVVLNITSNPLPSGLIDPRTSLDLKIVASDPTLPPKVVFVAPTSQGILLGFNKPMNPAGASDVNNYAVKYMTYGYARSVPIQSAQYDPATQSVTLIPKQPAPSFGGAFTNLTQVHAATTSVRRGHRSSVAGGLTDLQGNPINASTTPGKVELRDAYAPPESGSL